MGGREGLTEVRICRPQSKKPFRKIFLGRFNANRTARGLWGLTWDESLRLPSRLSAEPLVQAERHRLLAADPDHIVQCKNFSATVESPVFFSTTI